MLFVMLNLIQHPSPTVMLFVMLNLIPSDASGFAESTIVSIQPHAPLASRNTWSSAICNLKSKICNLKSDYIISPK